jgi:quinol monooxygenase YgiN
MHPGPAYTSGDWLVKEGDEEAFVGRWSALAGWCLEHTRGARSFRLIRDRADPRHFISFGEWDGFDEITVARSKPDFLQLFRACQALCDRSSGGDYTVALAAPEP